MKPTRFKILLCVSIVGIVWLLVAGLSCSSRSLLTRISRTYPGCEYFVETTEPFITLTIDDGPDSVNTAKILDVLSYYQAHATFFLISSRVIGNEPVVSEIVARGHEIGNHLTRDESSINLSPEEFERALFEADQILSWFGEVHWFRPGGGWYSETMLKISQKLNYRCALGSVYPFDAQIPWVWFASNYILQNVQPGDIVVLHDGRNRGARTVKILKKILPDLRRRGLKIVTLSQAYASRMNKDEVLSMIQF